MDGPDPTTRSPKALVTRVFEVNRLADEFLAAAYDRLLATVEPVGMSRPVPRPRGRRVTATAPTTTGGRGQ
jgi:hypothetical protein